MHRDNAPYNCIFRDACFVGLPYFDLYARIKQKQFGQCKLSIGKLPNTVKYTTKLAASEPGSFHVLDEAKARRMNAKTLYIPSVADVVDAIRAIPKGIVLASEDVRKSIADAHGADSCCPGKFKCYWQWSAFAMEFEDGPELPWWRMTKAGGPYAQMPGGAAGHAERMATERE